jgi:hypothetical protein
MGRSFARAYYRDELKSKGLNPDFKLSINDDYSKRNPKYYNDESQVNTYLGFQNSSNEDKSITKPVAKWEEDLNFGQSVLVIVIQDNLKLMKAH